MIAFTVLYGALAVIEFGLIRRVIHLGPLDEVDYADPQLGGSDSKQLVASY
jgi:cytochrome bd-type quinol oxidase subunit 1